MKRTAFLLISLYLGLVSASAQSSNGYDVNGDGEVNITDVTKMVTKILSQNEENGYDLNDDGDVNITDVILLVNYILGNNQEMPSLQLSTNSIYINGDSLSNQRLVQIISGSGSYTVTSSNNYVATAEIYPESYVTLTIKGLGETTITVYDEVSGKTATIQVDVRTLPHLVDDTRYLFLYVGQVKNVDISFGLSNKIGSGNYSVQNNIPDIAEVSIEKGKLKVTGLWGGHGYFWITDNDIKDENGNPITQEYEVRVELGNITCPDDNHPHMINLGLPSGTQWACCNVGASRPEGYGGYYAWGETEEKSFYNDVTYLYSTGSDEDHDGFYDDWHEGSYWDEERGDTVYWGTCGLWQDLGDDISGTSYDVAHVKWGEKWRMPSNDDFGELWDNCSYEEYEYVNGDYNYISYNGVYGAIFRSNKLNSMIFLPCASIKWTFDWNIDLLDYNCGYYQISEPLGRDSPNWAWNFMIDLYYTTIESEFNRGIGRSVRPVWKE